MKIPITQGKGWQKFQDDLGLESFYEESDGFIYLAIKKQTPVGNYLYCPYGPFAEDKKSFKAALKSLTALAHKTNSIFVRIEPQDLKFKTSLPDSAVKTKDLNPAHTLVIDIDKDDTEILSSVPRRTRGYYNTHEKKGITVELSHNPEDIKYLVNLQKILAKNKGIGVFSEEYLKKQLSQPFAGLYLVKYTPVSEDGVATKKASASPIVLAAVLIFDDEDTRYYIQAAQDKTYSKLAAPSIVVCQMLLDAKKKGLKYFDFWGIAPEGASKDHPWYGFTEFKKSFGGEPRSYLGTYDIVISPLKYRLYTITRRLNQLLKKA